MPRAGLTRDAVVSAAVELIEREGLSHFSMGALARSLGVKTASLYNHVESSSDLFGEVGRYAIGLLVQAQESALKGKSGDDALFALAEAYRTFARERFELYGVIMGLPKLCEATIVDEAGEIVRPIMRMLSGYGLSFEAQTHWQRVLRGVMYGFAAHEREGGFSHFPADENESYRIAIQCVADGLHREGGERHDR